MTPQTNTNDLKENPYEPGLRQLKRLVNQCNFEDARTLADKLVANGCFKPSICQACYDPMQRFIRLSQQAAIDFAREFKDYNFHCWLPENLRRQVQ